MNEQNDTQVQPVQNTVPVQPTEVPATSVQPEVPVSPEQPIEAPSAPIQQPEITAPVSPENPVPQVAEPAPPVQQTEVPVETPVAEPAQVQPTVQVAPQPTVEATPQVAPVQGQVEAAITPEAQVTPTPTVAVAETQPSVQNPTVQTTVEQTSLNGMINTTNQNGAVDTTSSGFVPMGEPLKKKSNKGVIITIVVLLLIALGLSGYFIIYPMIAKKYMNDPKNVYKTTISNFSTSLSSTVKELVYNKVIYDFNLSIDTNMTEFSNFSGYNYRGNLGVDPTNKAIQVGIEMTDSGNNQYSYFKYLKEGKEYARYSSYRDLIYIGEANMDATNELMSSFNELLALANKMQKDDYSYLISKLSTLLVDSIDESRLSKEDASITINGEKLKVIANKYSIDKATANKMMKHIMDGLKDDPKVITILKGICGDSSECTDDAIKKLLTYEESKSENKSDETVDINIYTYGNKNDVVGYSMNIPKKFNMYYYFKDNFFEIKATVNASSMDTSTKDIVLLIKGTTTNNKTNISISLNDTEIAKLIVNSWTETNKNVDYSINYEGTVCNGNITFIKDLNDNRGKYTLKTTFNMGTEYIKLTIDFTEDWTSEVANINTSAAVSVTESQLVQLETEFMNALFDSPLGKAFQDINGNGSLDIFNYYNTDNPNNPLVDLTS